RGVAAALGECRRRHVLVFTHADRRLVHGFGKRLALSPSEWTHRRRRFLCVAQISQARLRPPRRPHALVLALVVRRRRCVRQSRSLPLLAPIVRADPFRRTPRADWFAAAGEGAVLFVCWTQVATTRSAPKTSRRG